jgi:tetratricopeptide (TPR) repeat protein
LQSEEREKQRLQAQQREREAKPENDIFSTSGGAQNVEFAQVKAPPIAQSKGSTKRQPWVRVTLSAVLALILFFGLRWFASRGLREMVPVRPNPTAEAAPTATLVPPAPTPTPELTPTPTPNAAFHNSRGRHFYREKDYDTAISDDNDAIRLDPNDAAACNNRGLAHYARRDYFNAISDYSEAIGLDPKFAAAYFYRGLAYDASGEGLRSRGPISNQRGDSATVAHL